MSTVYNVGDGGDDAKAHDSLAQTLREQKRAGRLAGLYAAAGNHADGLLRLRAAMREHRRDRAARNEFVEMAAVPMALHGNPGVGAGVYYVQGGRLLGFESFFTDCGGVIENFLFQRIVLLWTGIFPNLG